MNRFFAFILSISASYAAWVSIFNAEGLEIGFINMLPGTWNINQFCVRLFCSTLILVSLNAIYNALKNNSINFIYWLGLAGTIVLVFSALNAPSILLSQNELTLTLSSLGTTLALIILLVILNKNRRVRLFSKALLNNLSMIGIIAIALAMPYLLAPVFPVYFKKKAEVSEGINTYFESQALLDGIINRTDKNKQLILFASPNCPHCNRVKIYLATALSNGEIDDKDVNIVYPKNATFSEKYIDSFEYPLPSTTVPEENFIKYTAGRFPLVYLVENDTVHMQWHISGFTYSDIPIIKAELK